MTKRFVSILWASLVLFFAPDAFAQSYDQIAALQAQINALQKQIDQLKAAQAKPQPAVRHVAQKPKPSVAPPPVVQAAAPVKDTPRIKITPGGFVELTGIARTKNEVADVGSNFNTAIPFDNSVNAHQSEFRGSARHSRLSLLAEGKEDNFGLSAYVETDFLGAAPTSNSVESNSYVPRLRQAYAAIDRDDYGVHVLAGQAWSLVTMTKTGITPRQENTPLVIDAQYVPGFNWTRNPQLRVVKDLDARKIALGLSLESPQANLGGITVPANVNATNPGGSTFSTNNYSSDTAPDIVAKAAFDPAWGHYETFGVLRFFHDNVLNGFHNNTVVAGGIGAGAILPVIPKKLDIQASTMVGQGIGRYASAQLPDFAFAPNGAIKPLTEYTGLLGAVAHPDASWDVYLYGGFEKVLRRNQDNAAYGYGDYGLNNAGCYVAGGTCPAQTASIWQITPGFWKEIYKGNLGLMKAGVQDSLTRRNAFGDANGNAPHAFENITMVSFRYYPF